MSEEIEAKEKNKKQETKLNKFIIFVETILTVMLLSYFSSVAYAIFISDTIYSGVFVDEIDAGGLSKEELLNKLKQKFNSDLQRKAINIKTNNEILSFKYSEINIKYDLFAAVENAFNFARTGSITNRFLDLTFSKTTPYIIDIPFTYDKPVIESKIDYLSNKVYIPVKEYEIVINQPTSASIISGHHGEKLNKEYAINYVEDYLKHFRDGDLILALEIISPKPIILDEVYSKINCEPQNPYPEVSGKNLRIIPPVMGRKIDKTALASILNTIKNKENMEISLPVSFSATQLTVADVEQKLFTHNLATFNTQFHTGDTNNNNRKVNIIIASNIINGTLLPPGGTFSFNKIVGPRTPENGYKDAHAYISGKIVDSTGGGICQVSTTLYNALLLANLDVIERHNHMFTVGYVPKGMDAAVSYGTADLVFKNVTAWPLKINSWVTEQNQVYFSLTGTNETPEKSFAYKSIIKDEFPPKTEITYDDTLPEGTKNVTNEGMTGYVVDTVKIVKLNGVVQSEEYIYTSKYAPYPKQIKIGTKKTENVQATSSKINSNSENNTHVTGVDDAYNPPVTPSSN